MSALVIPFPDVDDLHDRWIVLGRAYAEAPTPSLGRQVEEAYVRFYRAFNKSSVGLDDALADLRAKMAKRLRRRASA